MKDLYYIPDSPATEPVFEFGVVARGLMPLLVRRGDPGATVVGLHGPWGSGKTTLMDAIKRQVPTYAPNAVCVDFNAWKFQDRQVLWRALILQVLGELRRVKLEAWKQSNPGKSEDEFKDPALQEAEEKLYRAFSVDEKGPWKVQWRTLIVEVISIGLSVFKLGFVGTALKGSGNFLANLFGGGGKEDGKKDGKGNDILSHDQIKELAGVLEREVYHRQVHQVQSIEQFLGEFRKLIAALELEHRRVFVFIDDLDRCLPESALEVFEAIKLFLDAPGVSFVIALDRDTIRKALAVRYSRQGNVNWDQNLLDPDEYIEKTISVSFDLPRLSPEDGSDFISKVELPAQLDAARRKLIVEALGANPRRLRRFTNTLAVHLYIAEMSEGSGAKLVLDAANFDIFLKLMLLSYRHTALFAMVREQPELLIRLQKTCNIYAGTEDKKTAATERAASVALEGDRITALVSREDFWRLMKPLPLFTDHVQTVTDMLDWFRYRVPKQDGE